MNENKPCKAYEEDNRYCRHCMAMRTTIKNGQTTADIDMRELDCYESIEE